jgi:hypothetical protein
MRPEPEQTVVVKLEIPDPNLATTLLDQWTQHSDISLSILRGRVTAEEACYELRIEGGAAEVATIIRQSAPWRAARRRLNAMAAGTPA